MTIKTFYGRISTRVAFYGPGKSVGLNRKKEREGRNIGLNDSLSKMD